MRRHGPCVFPSVSLARWSRDSFHCNVGGWKELSYECVIFAAVNINPDTFIENTPRMMNASGAIAKNMVSNWNFHVEGV